MKLKFWIRGLAGRAVKLVNGNHVVGMIAETENGTFIVDPEDTGVGAELRRTGKYGVEEIDRLKHFMTSESRVLIVGAHLGALAVPIAHLCKEVVAIEANPITYQLLLKNLALNEIKNCVSHEVAASEKEEEIEFLLSRANSGGAKRVPKIKEYMYYYDNPQEIVVKAYSMDSYLDNLNFDVIIMDIEGSEYFALKGMQKILENSKALAVEFLPHHLKNVASVDVSEFLKYIEPHFSTLNIPSKNDVIPRNQFQTYLERMYRKEQGDPAMIFYK